MPGPIPLVAIAMSKSAGTDSKQIAFVMVACAVAMIISVVLFVFGVVRKRFTEALANGQVENSRKAKIVYGLRYLTFLIAGVAAINVLAYYFGPGVFFLLAIVVCLVP